MKFIGFPMLLVLISAAGVGCTLSPDAGLAEGAQVGAESVGACDVTGPGAEGCCAACGDLSACGIDVTTQACANRCMETQFIFWNDERCLALRHFWIDEEGCSRMVPTWFAFDDDDDCTGPPPDTLAD